MNPGSTGAKKKTIVAELFVSFLLQRRITGIMQHRTQQCSPPCLFTGRGESEKVQQPRSEAHVRTDLCVF